MDTVTSLETYCSVHAVERFLNDRTHPVGSLGGELLAPGGEIAEVPLGCWRRDPCLPGQVWDKGPPPESLREAGSEPSGPGLSRWRLSLAAGRPLRHPITARRVLPLGELLYAVPGPHYFRTLLCDALKELLKCVITVCIVI